jgi:DNA polymerase, archaea type
MADPKHSLLPLFQANQVLFGHDATQGLIACEVKGSDKVELYFRHRGETRVDLAPFEPLLILAGEDDLKGWKGEAKIEKLDGAAPFNCLVLFPDLKQLDDAKNYLQKKSGKSPSTADAPFWYFSDPLHQFLLLSGKTHFKGMAFGELKRMQVDIETYCQAGFEFPNPSRASDRVTAIALADATGWEQLISGREFDEAEMLHEFVKEIQRRDPDVIEGHNLFRFDLEYIEARAKRHKVELALGRDGSRLRGHASRMQIADRTITYKKFEIYGRHIIDTWILAQHYDVATRELESFGLKDIARHFGVAGDQRVYVPGNKTSWFFDHDPDTLFRYAMDDVRETRAISELLSPSYYVQAQIFPYSYQNMPLRGNATKIDALLVREYLYRRRAVPRPEAGRDVIGGFTSMEFQGTARQVLHCDVTSLYPSIMLVYSYLPKKDDIGVMPGLLRDLRGFRVKAKELARGAVEDESRIYFNALQSTFKILINSFYGYLGFQMGRFNDFDAANRVTAKGRELIQAAVAWLKDKGAQIIEVDTDGIYFVPPPLVKNKNDEQGFIKELGEMLPEGIELELDGRYPAMFSYKMKNYALLDDKGRLLIKGSGLRSRGLELFQREWLEEMLMLLLNGEREKIPGLYERYIADIDGHDKNISWLAKTETLQDSLDSYQDKVKAKKRNAAAPYELALKAERPYQPGDQISYYVTGNKAKVKISDNCKLASQWEAEHPDENTEHYKAKLKELYEKFRPFIEDDHQGSLAMEDRG